MTAAIRMLAYGVAADQCAEIYRMGESTTLECMKNFCQQVEDIFGEEYFCAPTPTDLRRLLVRGEQRGFPSMIGRIDCMHWEWKNCSSRWGGAYSGQKGCPTIILEAVASYDTWIWHAFFGVLGAQNDINVLGHGALVSFNLDGLFFARHDAWMHKRSTLRSIMMTCIILHNMIVEDEFVESVEEDLMNPLASKVCDEPIDFNEVRIHFALVQRDGRNQQAF